MKPRVVYWNNIPSPYLVERLNTLVTRGYIDIEAWFNARTAHDTSWAVEESKWLFSYRYLPTADLCGQTLRIPLGVLSRTPPHLLVSLYAEPCFIVGSSIARWRRVRTAYWVEPTFDTWTPRRPWREALKRQLFPRVDAIFTTGDDGRTFVSRYGARADRIISLPYFADHQRFAHASAQLKEHRSRWRSDLGITGTAFLYVGRLWWGKGLSYLLDAFAELRRSIPDVTLLLVGDGEEEARLRERCQLESIQNVVFAGFADRDDLPRYYTAADVFVFPTLGDPFGQVVGEAMSCSLPIISSAAAGEIRARVEDGVNGYIVPPANSAALLDRMQRLATNPALRSSMGQAAVRSTAAMTQQAWACTFEEAVGHIVSSDHE
jgi:glycosyltransferase involved in cell wall biosynthesis